MSYVVHSVNIHVEITMSQVFVEVKPSVKRSFILREGKNNGKF